MNTGRPTSSETEHSEHYRSLQILTELSDNDTLTQRDLSSRLGIALGLVNSYVKNLITKGYITVASIPPKRYAYYLTPKGFAEKTRLAYDLLADYTRVYREARKNLNQLFHELQQEGIRKVVFAGADEVAEIAYITLQETNLILVAMLDPDATGKPFFRLTSAPIESIRSLRYDGIIVTSYLKRERIYRELLSNGVRKQAIKTIFEV